MELDVCWHNKPMRVLTILITIVICATALFAQAPQRGGRGDAFANNDWNKPFPAHKVIGNVYFIGSEQLGSFLITTPEGHILINSDYLRRVMSTR
jgi:hypothetical protein